MIAASRVVKFSPSLSAPKDALPMGQWIMLVLSRRYSILPALASVVCSVCMNESCTDSCYVAPCYEVGSCVRNCAPESCDCMDNARADIGVVSSEEYKLQKHYEGDSMKNLTGYYQITVSFILETYTELEDVWIQFDVADVNGNAKQGVTLYMGKRIKPYAENAVKKESTVIFKFPEKGGASHPDNASYGLYISNIKVMARA